MRSTFAKAEIIACTTAETRARIPAGWRGKCIVQPAIGIDELEIHASACGRPSTPQFLFVGRLLYWKGLHLAFRALARARPSLADVKLKIIGTGEDRAWLEQQSRVAGVTDLLEWVASTPHDQIAREYGQSLALLFPSLHDSGGMVVLESLAAGLPVICLDLGGPGAIATPECAMVVPARHISCDRVIEELADAIIRMANDAPFRAGLAAHAITRAKELTWDRAASHLYAALDGPH
jgi:glycosyltransferase involved in cell wall biosynthesis